MKSWVALVLILISVQTVADSLFDWRASQGVSLNVLLSEHPLTSSLRSREAEFEALTGIDVVFKTLPEDQYRVHLVDELSSPVTSVDVFMTGPSSNWEYARRGWIEDLQPFVDDRSSTPLSWDFKDFYEGAVNTNRWTGEEFSGAGKGPLYGIPMTQENYILYYRKDVLESRGIAVPQTVEQLIETAMRLDGVIFRGKELDGFVARGHGLWPILITGYGALLFAYGAVDIEMDGSSGADGEEAILATKAWAKLMQYTPEDIADYDWMRARDHFMAGGAVFFLDADNMAPVIMDPVRSSVSGSVGFALPPEGPAGRASGIWLWALGMNSRSLNKDAAWRFILWASGKSQMIQLVQDGAFNPTRRSVAESSEMEMLTAKWPGYLEVFKQVATLARWHWNPATRFSETGNRWAMAVLRIYRDDVDAATEMRAAAKDIDQIMYSERYQ